MHLKNCIFRFSSAYFIGAELSFRPIAAKIIPEANNFSLNCCKIHKIYSLLQLQQLQHFTLRSLRLCGELLFAFAEWLKCGLSDLSKRISNCRGEPMCPSARNGKYFS
jgi:hypothetical protein